MDCCVLAVSRAFSVAYVKSTSMHDCIYRRKYPDTKSASLYTKGTKRWILLYVLYIYIYGTFYEILMLVNFIYIASNSKRYIFKRVCTIDFLFSALHTTPFLYVKIYFGVLHLLRARIATSDTTPGSNPT